jgi:hypothetical protein
MVTIELEVVYAPIDYKLLLRQSWMYVVKVVMSLVFHLLKFPHQGKIVTIDQLTYHLLDHVQDPG